MPTKIDFIGGNTKRCFMAMALPMIAAMFLNMMYNLVACGSEICSEKRLMPP